MLKYSAYSRVYATKGYAKIKYTAPESIMIYYRLNIVILDDMNLWKGR